MPPATVPFDASEENARFRTRASHGFATVVCLQFSSEIVAVCPIVVGLLLRIIAEARRVLLCERMHYAFD